MLKGLKRVIYLCYTVNCILYQRLISFNHVTDKIFDLTKMCAKKKSKNFWKRIKEKCFWNIFGNQYQNQETTIKVDYEQMK